MADQLPASQKKRMGCLGVGLRVVLALAALLLVVGVLGAIYESWAGNAAADQYPPPGEIVEVNGRAMHIQCMGEGSPTVVLDAGQGGWSTDWSAIMPQIAERTQVCAYDRAGYGWSEPAQDQRTPQQAADDLAGVLAAAEIAPPYILVGFSHAGLGNRIFAAQNASDMAGMILVDPATEFDNEILGPELLQQQRSATGVFNLMGLLARLGVIRLLDPQSMAGSAPFIGVNPANPDIYYTFVAHPTWWQTSLQEFSSRLNDDHLAMVRAEGAIPQIPLTIIASEVLEPAGNAALADMQVARHAALADLAAQSPQGEFIVAEGSTHDVLGDRPDVIVDAVDRMLDTSAAR